MDPIRIIVDSAADLTAQDRAEYGIDVVSQVVTQGSEAYEDASLTPDAFWELAKRGTPGTSQPPVGAFEEAYERWVSQGYRVLCITVTGRHSGTCNTAQLAGQRYGERVTVFDSLGISAGQGWLALVAAQMVRAHASLDQIVETLRSVRARTHTFILLDSLESLRRGGRAARLMPYVNRLMRAFDLKLIISFVDGELKLSSVVRSYSKGLERMKQEIQRLAPMERLAVIHTRRQAMAQQLADELAELLAFPRQQIMVMETRAALASHAGPGATGIFGVSVS